MWQYEIVAVDVEDTDDSINSINRFLELQSEDGSHLEQVVPLKWVTGDEYVQVIKYLFIFKYPTTQPTNLGDSESK